MPNRQKLLQKNSIYILFLNLSSTKFFLFSVGEDYKIVMEILQLTEQ